MSKLGKLSISLTPELASLVRSAVTEGDYTSTSEVIREALRDWKIKQKSYCTNEFSIVNIDSCNNPEFDDLYVEAVRFVTESRENLGSIISGNSTKLIEIVGDRQERLKKLNEVLSTLYSE